MLTRTNQKSLILVLIILVIIGVIYYLERQRLPRLGPDAIIPLTDQQINNMSIQEKQDQYPRANKIVSPAGYVNTDGVSIEELIGKKVILVDFWTYSCINCQRTLPYLTAWYDKYQDQGLEIVGVHTPEFEFEKKLKNVQGAVEQFGIKYPVVLDNDYATWNAYKNRYWPRKYLIDIDGFIVYDHIGEGGYQETEHKIQELLTERMNRLGQDMTISSDMAKPSGVEEVDYENQRSPEIYFGALRNSHLGNGKQGKKGIQAFSEPSGIKTDVLYLVGEWDITDEYAENKSAGAKIIFRYQAQKVFFVGTSDKAVSLQILKDGQPVQAAAGRDVKQDDRSVRVQSSQLYRVIEASEHGEHTLEMVVDKPGLQIFTFTFG